MERFGGNRIFRCQEGRSSVTVVIGLISALFIAVPCARATDIDGDLAPAVSPTATSTGPVPLPKALSFVVLESRANPWIQINMNSGVRERILEATQIASQRIQQFPECAEMFAALGADGIEALSSTLYFPIENPIRRRDFCQRVVTYTYVGASATWVCPDFKRLPVERAAVVLIHEALHHAGLTEYPSDRDGMTSHEINRMVKMKCEF